MRLLQTTEGKH